MKPPVTTGEIIELTVTGQSHTGDGVGKYEVHRICAAGTEG